MTAPKPGYCAKELKKVYRGKGQAEKMVQSIRDNRRSGTDDEGLHAYRCGDHWHVGHSEKVQTRAAKATRRRPIKPKRDRSRRTKPDDRVRLDAEGWDEATLLLWHRSRDRCECGCGQPLRNTGQRHHRKLRSQGGDDRLSNLLLLLPEHHARVHREPRASMAAGLIVRSVADPTTTPLVRDDGRRWLLTDDGKMRPLP